MTLPLLGRLFVEDGHNATLSTVANVTAFEILH